MKKLFSSIFFTLTIYSSLFISAEAQYSVVCVNCSTIMQQVDEFITQKAQLGKDILTSSASGVTATQQTIQTVNDTILIPMKDAATLIAITQSGDLTRNLILGSLGTDPLLVANPEGYIRNQGISVAKSALGSLAKEKSVEGDSVLGSLFSKMNYKYSGVNDKLKKINQSAIPSILQDNICPDEKLTELATEQLESAGVEYSEVDIAAKKSELYDYACNGDPNTDKDLAARLKELNRQKPELGGWDSWLALTSGDNGYTKAELSAVEIDTAAKERQDTVAAQLIADGGIRSLTECVSRSDTDLNGDDYVNPDEAPCDVTKIIQTGSSLRSAYEESVNAPLKTLISSFGSGAGSLLNSAFSTINLIKGVGNAIGSVTGSLTGSVNSITSSANSINGSLNSSTPLGTRTSTGGYASNNTAYTIRSAETTKADLSLNGQAKEDLISVPLKQLNFHRSTLTTLETSDNSFITEINYYQNQLNSTKSCFDYLANNYNAGGDARVSSFMSYYASKTSANNSLKSAIQNELSQIEITRTLIAETIIEMNKTQSSTDLLRLFNTYQNSVDRKGLPQMSSGPTREGELISFKSDVEQSLTNGGSLVTFNAQCSAITAEYQAQRAYQNRPDYGSSSD